MTVLSIYGTPAPKGSRIPGLRKDGTVFTRPASKNEKAWVECVAREALSHELLEPPYMLVLTFHMARPKKPAHGWPTRGDLDKLVRSTIDGLVNGNLILDDRHVVVISASKRWVTEEHHEGATVTVDRAVHLEAVA